MSHAAPNKNTPFFKEEDFLPFTIPCVDEDVINSAIDCLKSGWIATGPRVQKFETDLCEYLACPHAIAVNSATSGLHLALLACGIGANGDGKKTDEVITTPMTFVSTVNSIIHAGATPVFVDVEPNTYNMDISKIEAAITPHTKAIMPVHFTGMSVDLDLLYEIARKHNLRVIEDAAHAIGSSYKGRKIGSFGDIQVYSFHPCKNMTTAEGGALSVHDAETAKKMRIQRFHGIAKDAWDRYSKDGNQQIDVITPGHKYNMSDLQAAIGIPQLQKLDAMNVQRQKHVARYKKAFESWDEITLPQDATYENFNAFHIYAILINPEKADGMTRDTLMAELKNYNIGTGLHYPAVHLFDYYKKTYGFKRGDFPRAETISDRILSLPLFPQMTEEQQDRVISALSRIFNKPQPSCTSSESR
ncbi:MAG TPA: UDP-4-amino-4,6-dideoxy-N-acetyl-beta-L-altrosamine transaminase [Holosporales bacterium]|nr:UDP-4-amino-4,6-dideoxy-N-acetyl-beta-L-altrosamine transaminase [Holosporales bacterium]